MGFSNLYNIIPGNKSTALLLITTRKQIGQLALREPIATDKALIFCQRNENKVNTRGCFQKYPTNGHFFYFFIL